MCAEFFSVPPFLRVTAKRVGAACLTPRADSATVVVADPAAAYAAGTVYLEAKTITGKATLVYDAEDAAKYRIVKKSKTVGDVTTYYLCVDKAGLSIHIHQLATND